MSLVDIIHSFITRRRTILVSGASFFLLFLIFLHGPDVSTPNFRRRSQTGLARDIYNQTLGFGNIFVVGLPSRTDRRDGMTLQASLSNLKIEFIDGVRGQDVPDNAIPRSKEYERLKDASVGSWRAHLNAAREIVARNISCGLIVEDDIDWDIRIQEQMADFARSANALLQPLAGAPGHYADPTYRVPSEKAPDSVPDISFENLPITIPPKLTPYGDDWDVMWLGHCGTQIPVDKRLHLPNGRVVQRNDQTAAAKKHLWSFANPFRYKDMYPDHTRVVHHVQEGVCTLAYALSQRGARKLLLEVGLKDLTDAYDILLQFFCEGSHGRNGATCLTTQPSLFNHFRPVGPRKAMSDIGDHDGFNDKSGSDMIRWSVRLNADKILAGDTNYRDQFPDN